MKTPIESDDASRHRRDRRRFWMRRLAIACATSAVVFTIDYFAYPYGNLASGRSGNRGENGLWLRYTWYFGEKSEAELAALPLQLVDRQIVYAWFHVRSIKKDGTLAYRY